MERPWKHGENKEVVGHCRKPLLDFAPGLPSCNFPSNGAGTVVRSLSMVSKNTERIGSGLAIQHLATRG